ncbi:MAG: carboxypeptidase regulatory-like domain-containing protein [Gemmatimonadaceae bacterium]|nr:carboxypeptidase regulatory-like domain-containing protein [Gemmatimonadaceae bacterium]
MRVDAQGGARTDSSGRENGGLVGTVVDVIGKPMADVEVYLAKSGRVVRTDSRGVWRVPNPSIGPVVVVARAVGYVPYVREVVVTSGVNDSVTLLLRRYPRTLSAVQITANSNAATADAEIVAERLKQMKVSAGRLYTRTQILEQRPYSLAELIQGVPGIVVKRVDREIIATSTRSGIGSSQVDGQGPCQLQFYINGTPVDNEGALTLDPLNFRSVEVYPQTVLLPGLPSRGDKCGAIVVNMLRR